MTDETETDVLIAGAGPVGLTVAIELARRGVRCRVVEQQPVPRESTRGCTVYQRTLEVFDAMGVPVGEYVAAGAQMRRRLYHLFGEPVGAVDMAEPGSLWPFPLVIGQNETERRLADLLAGYGVAVERGTVAVGLTQDDSGVGVTLRHHAGGSSLVRASWLVAAQGAASTIRESLGVEWKPWRRFSGLQMLQIDARVHLPFELRPDEAHMFFGAGGHVGCVPLPGGRHRVFVVERGHPAGASHPPQPAEVSAAMERLSGAGPVGLTDCRFGWRVRLQNRFAERLRVGRCLLAGDSARVFAPVHAQGLNTGVQDAFNLGWKVAAVVRDGAPPELLDTYAAERSPVAEELLGRTERSLDFAVQDRPDRTELLSAVMVNRGKRTQLAIGYPASPLTRDLLGDASGPRAGQRAPGRWDGRWTLVVCPGSDRDGRLFTGRDPRVKVLAARDGVPAELRSVPGRVYLIRPDGHIGLRAGLEHGSQVHGYLDKILGTPRTHTQSEAEESTCLSSIP